METAEVERDGMPEVDKIAMRMHQQAVEIKYLRQKLLGVAEETASEVSVTPNDSSSVLERYATPGRLMPRGTVFTAVPVQTSAGRQQGSTMLSVHNSLVSGYYTNEDLRSQEQRSVKRLRPINGLPSPFVNSRLNFLCNFHTGLDRAKDRSQNGLLAGLFEAMRSTPLIPADDLLNQVLNCTIDREDCVFTSNAFKLPYIEIGMHVSEESLMKMFDLLYGEYKNLWFQEYKGLTVPGFHSEYASRSHDPLSRRSHRVPRKAGEAPRSRPREHVRTRTILGF